MPYLRCKNCSEEICSTGKNDTTPWVHLLTGWVKCIVGKGKAEPSD